MSNLCIVTYGGDSPPITDINMYRIQAGKDGKCIVIPEKYGIIPLCIHKYNQRPIFKSKLRKTGNEYTYFYYGNFDLTEYLEQDRAQTEEDESKKTLLWFWYYRKVNEPPITKIEFINLEINPETGKPIMADTKMKLLPYTFGGGQKRSLWYDTRNIQQRKFIPQVLSRYPVENRPYYPFPENIASFWMTTGIRIEFEDPNKKEYQSPKFFSFILTDHEGTRIFWACLIFKENPIYPELKESLQAYNITNSK